MDAPKFTDYRHKFPAIPEPQPTIESLVQVVNALKEIVEMITDQRQRGREMAASPTWGDLVNVGVVKPDQVMELKNERLSRLR